MAVRVRLRRMGRKKQAHYRIVVADSKSPRDGRFVESLGYYKPLSRPARVVLDVERYEYGIGQGASPSGTVNSLFNKVNFAVMPVGLEVYHEVARANGGEPEAGRRLLQWVQAAGFTEPVPTTSVWSYADPEGRRQWAELWAGRIQVSAFAERCEELGVSDAGELARIGEALRRWAEDGDGWFAFIHGEVLARSAR